MDKEEVKQEEKPAAAAIRAEEAGEEGEEAGPRVRMFEIVGWDDGESDVEFEVSDPTTKSKWK